MKTTISTFALNDHFVEGLRHQHHIGKNVHRLKINGVWQNITINLGHSSIPELTFGPYCVWRFTFTDAAGVSKNAYSLQYPWGRKQFDELFEAAQ
jgi:hypothetical protein